jgi:hypothetical protein
MSTLIQIGLENDNDGRSIAWALDHPGCFAYGQDGSEALLNVPRAVVSYQEWIGRHTPDSWLKGLRDFDVRLEETWQVYTINEDYDEVAGGNMVESWFRHDWKPLNVIDVRRAASLLKWAREDLRATVADLSASRLDQTYPGERWSIRGILEHVADADVYYLNSVGLGDLNSSRLPRDVFERLRVTRAAMEAALPEMAGLEKVVGSQGELWSPRKLVRRAVWHELDHIGHIRKLT